VISAPCEPTGPSKMLRRLSGTMTRTMMCPWHLYRRVSISSVALCHHVLTLISARTKRQRNTARMQEILEAEQQTDDASAPRSRPRQKKSSGKRRRTALSDPEDEAFSVISLSTDPESESSISDGIPIEEVRLLIYLILAFLIHFQLVAMLPSKTKPLKARRSKGKSKAKAKASSTRKNKSSAAASKNTVNAAISRDHNKNYDHITDTLDGGTSQAPPLQASASAASLERSNSFQKKVCSLCLPSTLHNNLILPGSQTEPDSPIL
jgi:hypothetical protein